MANETKVMTLLFFIVLALGLCYSKSIGQQEEPSYQIKENVESVDDILMNYLFARQMYNKLRNNLDIGELQRKRSYWRECAFNAVSCFGRKKK